MIKRKTGESHKKTFSLLLLVLIFVACSCSKKVQEEEYITIGALLPLTGSSADEGLRAFNGLNLAREEINANGGISGKKLDVIVLNDRGNREYIVQQYNALMERGVTAIIGSSYSGPTLALAIAAEKDGMPVISPTASDPAVTLGRGNVFRAIFIDDYQAEAMAHFAHNSLGAQTAVVLINRNYDSYTHTAEVFTRSFTARGGRVRAVESFSSENDFAYILGKYAANPPDVIFCPEDFIPAARLVNTVHEIGLGNTYILGTDAWDGLLAYVHNPQAMERAYYSAPFSYDDNSPDVAQFVRNYFNAFSLLPLTGSATAYNCVYILAEAIKKAESTDRDAIVSAMRTNEFDVMTGRVKFDKNNNPQTNVYIIQIKDGVYSTREKIYM